MAPFKTGKDDGHKTNRIRICFSECIEVEVESEELNFLQLKEEALLLLDVAKKTVIKTPANHNEVA